MRTAWRAAQRGWEAFWFTPEGPANLAAARMLFAAHALWILLSRDLPALSGLPPEFWAGVPESARWRFLIWEGRPVFETLLQGVAVAALTAAILGVAARACCLVAGLLLYHLAPLETLFLSPSPWLKGLTLAVPALVAFALSPCGDALSVVRRSSAAREPSWEYAWPVRFAQLLVCQMYFFGGYAKLFHTGWEWASAANIRAWLLRANQDDQLVVFDAVGPWIADRPALCLMAGAGALALELGFGLVLFWKGARRWLVPAAAALHAAILVSMNYFFLYAPLLLVFVDWSATLRAPRPGAEAEPRPGDPPRA